MKFNDWTVDGDGNYLLALDSQVYCVEAVLNTAYLFTHRAHIAIATHDDSCIAVKISLDASDTNVQEVCRAFLQELVDQQLRVTVGKDTADLKRLIITEAFAPLEEARHKEPS